MGVDKTLEVVYDLASLNEQQASQLISANEDVIKSAESQKKKSTKKLPKSLEKRDVKIEKRMQKLVKNLEFEKISKKQKKNLGTQIFGRVGLGKLISFQQNPVSFIGSFAKQLVPILGPALLAAGVIAAVIRKIDNFQKQFIDRVDDRIDVFRSKEQQALIQAGLTQLIITTSTGGAEPRDAYNTFAVFNENQSKIESEFQIRNISGVD